MPRLVLFDIDCTLLDTGGAGMASLKEAAGLLYGSEGPELDLAGSTDSGILKGILEHFQLPYEEAHIESFYRVYLECLAKHLTLDTYGGRLLEGVSDLLELLVGYDDVYLGLLTGNIALGAAKKTQHYKVDQYFDVGAYGDDHWDRNKLGPIALERAQNYFDQAFTPEQTVVIGDTPKDTACGKVLGAKTICVATGKFTAEQLRVDQPDVVLNDLVDQSVNLDVILS